MAVVPSLSEGPAPTSLADTLSLGPLPLAVALGFANNLALELRDLHQSSRAYGKLTLHSISIAESGAHLAPVRSYWERAAPERDIQAFGSIFYQMLHGNPAPSTVTADDIRIHPSQTGPERLRASGTKLALRCISARGSRLSMQQVATELRLLTVMQRQEDTHSRPAGEELLAPVPLVPSEPRGPQALPIEETEVSGSSLATDAAATLPVVPLGPGSFGSPKPKTPAKEAPAGGRCPKCACAVVYVSRPRSRIEGLFERMKFPIVRCHRCYYRYLVIGTFKIPKDMPVGSARKFRLTKRHY